MSCKSNTLISLPLERLDVFKDSTTEGPGGQANGYLRNFEMILRISYK